MAVLACLTGLGAAAQEVRPLALTDIDGYLEFRIKNREESRQRLGEGSSWESEELEFRERLRLDLDGYVYHPRLLHFQLGGLFENVQNRYGGTSNREDREDNVLLGGDFRISIFEEHPYRFTFFGERRESEVDVPFSTSYLAFRESYGVSFDVRSGPIPFQVYYAHGTTETEGGNFDIEDVRDELRIRGRYTLGKRSDGSLEYHMSKIEEKAQRRLEDSQEFTLSNLTRFGREDRIRLHSYARAYDLTGTTDARAFSLRENLTWQHKDNLQTTYQASFDRTENGGETVDRWDARVSVSHDLYQSLHTRAEAFASLQQSVTGDTRRYGGRLTETYTKRLGGWGRLGVTLGGTVELTETESRAATNAVMTTTGDANIRLDVKKWLSLYSGYGFSEQTQEEGSAGTRLESMQRYRVGSEVRWKWFTFGAEYENRDSVFSPSEKLSQRVTVSKTFGNRWRTSLSASHSESTFTDTGRGVESLGFHGSTSAWLTRRSELRIEGDYRRQEWTGFGPFNDVEAYSAQAVYVWRYRKLTAQAKARVAMNDQRGQLQEESKIEFSLKREF